MKQSIYHRIPEIATEDLIELQHLFAGLCEDRISTPKRHDYRGKCLLRISLELETRANAPTPPPAKLYERRITPTNLTP